MSFTKINCAKCYDNDHYTEFFSFSEIKDVIFAVKKHCFRVNMFYEARTFGIGNGYIILKNGDAPVEFSDDIIHEGISYDKPLKEFEDQFNLKFNFENIENYRVVGFDTAHFDDIEKFNTVESILKELLNFFK